MRVVFLGRKVEMVDDGESMGVRGDQELQSGLEKLVWVAFLGVLYPRYNLIA